MLAEERRVASGRADDELIVLRNIRKVYAGGKVAVHNLSFGIPKGECFGFLVRLCRSLFSLSPPLPPTRSLFHFSDVCVCVCVTIPRASTARARPPPSRS